MKKGEFFDCRTETTLERNRDMEKTSEQLQKDVDLFLANKGKIETCNNLGEPIAAPKQELEVNKLARGWIKCHYPYGIAVMKAKKLGIKFNLVIAERQRMIKRGRA